MSLTLQHRRTASMFPLLNAITYAALFSLTENFISRDINKIMYWGAAGFVIGLALGIVIQRALAPAQKQLPKASILAGLLLLQFLLGLLLIGPSTWLLLRFVPTSNIHSICCETPLDYGATQYETVQITTDDGATITGWYVAPGSQAGKVIILIHGYGYDRRGTDFQTRALIAAGYGVLLYDLRDHGESVGKLTLFNRMDVYQADLLRVVSFVKQKPEVNPAHIGVVGISLGAFSTLNSSTDTLNSFAGLWLDGLRFENFGAPLPAPAPIYYLKSIFRQQAELLASLFYQHTITAAVPLFTDIIPHITQPKLMLVSSGLDKDERATNERFIPLMGGNKQIWFIDNAWHIGGRFEAPDEYRNRMLAFFAEAMKD